MNSIVKPTKYGNLTYFSLNSYLSPTMLLKQNKKYSFRIVKTNNSKINKNKIDLTPKMINI